MAAATATIEAALCITVGGICCSDDRQCDIDCGICPTGLGKRAKGSGACRRRNGISHIDVGIRTIDLPLSRTYSGGWLVDRGVSPIDSPILAIGAALSTSRSSRLIIERGTSESQRSSAESSNSFPRIPRVAAAIEHPSGRMGAASRRLATAARGGTTAHSRWSSAKLLVRRSPP
jgi:hypothetical protein